MDLINSRICNEMGDVALLRGIPELSPLIRSGKNTRTWLFIFGMGLADICIEEIEANKVSIGLSEQTKNTVQSYHRDDRGLLDAISTGMPPTVGLGLSISRLIQVLSDMTDIRELEWWRYQ